jgi:hypothetical protein
MTIPHGKVLVLGTTENPRKEADVVVGQAFRVAATSTPRKAITRRRSTLLAAGHFKVAGTQDYCATASRRTPTSCAPRAPLAPCAGIPARPRASQPQD